MSPLPFYYHLSVYVSLPSFSSHCCFRSAHLRHMVCKNTTRRGLDPSYSLFICAPFNFRPAFHSTFFLYFDLFSRAFHSLLPRPSLVCLFFGPSRVTGGWSGHSKFQDFAESNKEDGGDILITTSTHPNDSDSDDWMK